MDIRSTLSIASGLAREHSRADVADAQYKKALAAGQAAGGRDVALIAPAGQAGGASREQVEDAVATIQEFVQSVRRSINFSVDDGSGYVVVKVTDAGSGDVIRQIPSEDALRLAENLSEVRSLLFKAEA
jgi:flagellar protein FlaG